MSQHMVKENPLVQDNNFHNKEKGVIVTFLLSTFLVGITGALQIPVLSTFLKEQVNLPKFQPFFIHEIEKIPDFWIGFFFFLNAFIGMIIGQFIGIISDRVGNRKNLITLGCLFGILQCVLFAFSRNYWFLLMLGVLLSSVAGSVHAQLFAMAREFTMKRGKTSDLFTSTMRAGISLAWVLGPPIAFYMIIHTSFTALYIASAIGLLLSLVMVLLYLPKINVVPIKKKLTSTENKQKTDLNYTVILLTIACTFLFAANGMYLITMPLYVVETLKLAENLPGLMMGFVAGLEIPFIIIMGFFASRFPKKYILMACALCGFIFYLIMIMADTAWLLLAAQVFNAIFIGLLASIGIIYFQELMPNQAGNATTLFMNSGKFGSLLSGMGFSVSVQLWGYIGVFYLSAILALLAVICLVCIKGRQDSHLTIAKAA